MIYAFRHVGLKHLFEKGDTNGIPRGLAIQLGKLLDLLDAATELDDLRSAGLELTLISKGRFKGFQCVTVSGARKLIFRWVEGRAIGVDLVLLQVRRQSR